MEETHSQNSNVSIVAMGAAPERLFYFWGIQRLVRKGKILGLSKYLGRKDKRYVYDYWVRRPFNWEVGRPYRLKLVMRGNRISGYLDGELMAEKEDAAPLKIHTFRFSVYHAAASIDNVKLTGSNGEVQLEDDFSSIRSENWREKISAAPPAPAGTKKQQHAVAQPVVPDTSAPRSSEKAVVRFGMSADPHMVKTWNRQCVKDFVKAMRQWKPEFVIDMGDFAVQVSSAPVTTPEMHDGQLEWLKRHWELYQTAGCPAYLVMGNHDVGWIWGGDEHIKPEELYKSYYQGAHGGEDITKDEWLAVTKLPGRYYSFDAKGVHFIVLDGNNWRGKTAVAKGHDGVAGAYWIDDSQRDWLEKDLAANREKVKFVFCHEELHHTPVEGSGQGGDVPFPPVGKERSYVDNGWQIREMLAKDGKVVACFHGHKHRNRWAVYDGIHYVTLAAIHWEGSYARVTVTKTRLHIEGVGSQRSYAFPLKGF